MTIQFNFENSTQIPSVKLCIRFFGGSSIYCPFIIYLINFEILLSTRFIYSIAFNFLVLLVLNMYYLKETNREKEIF
jgi:hypothetical protein